VPSPDLTAAHGAPAVAPSENGRAPVPTSKRLASIVGLGRALPQRIVGNDEIAALIGVDEEWIVRRTGIHTRHRAGEGEGIVSLALEASRAALADAGLTGADLDYVLVATVGPDEMLPNAAPLLAEQLGATPAPAMDLGAACSGSLYGLTTGAALIESGRADRVLVVGVEILSRFLDPDDRRVLPLFGDGAGAMVLSSEGQGGLGPVILHANGALGYYIRMAREERMIRM
jgi:3-oxoacyl-[acyl-carrier-protein] synthase-3